MPDQLTRESLLQLPAEALLTPAEVACLLSVHVNTVLRLAKASKLPAFPLPLSTQRKIWRFRKSDILSLGAPSKPAVSSLGVPVPALKGGNNGEHGK